MYSDIKNVRISERNICTVSYTHLDVYKRQDVGDEKEIREYGVSQLKFKPRRRKEKVKVDDKELKKLEALEKNEGKSKLDDN